MSKRRPGSTSQPGAKSAASSTGNDSGDQTARSVYMRRRIIVLLGLIAVVAAVALIIIRPGSTSGNAQDIKKVEVPSDLTEEPETPGDDTTEPETVACTDGQLEVEAGTDKGSYGSGELPELSLSVTNTGDAECIADLGTAGMTFTVSSGADDVWRSTDCQASRDELPVILEAGETLESESIPWDRTRSSTETCEIVREPVVAGGASYHLNVSVGSSSSTETAQFLLY